MRIRPMECDRKLELMAFFLNYFYPFIFISPVYLLIRIRYSFSFKVLQRIRLSTSLFLSIGASIYFFIEAINSGPGAMALMWIFFPPYSITMYIFGACIVVLMELLVFIYQKIRDKPLVTYDNIPQFNGLLKLLGVCLIVGLLLPILVFAIFLLIGSLIP
jgi:branched-subunit amino acid ABC-type transport system permease component